MAGKLCSQLFVSVTYTRTRMHTPFSFFTRLLLFCPMKICNAFHIFLARGCNAVFAFFYYNFRCCCCCCCFFGKIESRFLYFRYIRENTFIFILFTLLFVIRGRIIFSLLFFSFFVFYRKLSTVWYCTNV